MPGLDKQIAEIVGWKPQKVYCERRENLECESDSCHACCHGVDEPTPPYSRDLNLITAAVEKLGYRWFVESGKKYHALVEKGSEYGGSHSESPASALCLALLAAEKAKGGNNAR